MTIPENLLSINQSLQQDSPYALIGGRLFDSNDGVMQENKALLIQGKHILALCSPDDLSRDTPRVDITGHCILPGLIDVHVHTEDWHAPLYLAHGITAVRDVGCDLEDVLERRSRWNASDSAPRLVVHRSGHRPSRQHLGPVDSPGANPAGRPLAGRRAGSCRSRPDQNLRHAGPALLPGCGRPGASSAASSSSRTWAVMLTPARRSRLEQMRSST